MRPALRNEQTLTEDLTQSVPHICRLLKDGRACEDMRECFQVSDDKERTLSKGARRQCFCTCWRSRFIRTPNSVWNRSTGPYFSTHSS
jgi:hypothetical protein